MGPRRYAPPSEHVLKIIGAEDAARANDQFQIQGSEHNKERMEVSASSSLK
jgi:hypothetical protein